MLTEFMEFPILADYWQDPKELIFDPKHQVQLNLDHIIKDNLNRFPEELGGRLDKNNVPVDLEDQSMLIRLTPKSTRFGGDLSVPWLTGCLLGFRRCILDVAMNRCTARHTSEPPRAR